MDSAIVLFLAVLALLPEQTHDHQIDVVTAQRMKEREEFLHHEMMRLWQDVERIRTLEKALLPFLLQHWLFWAIAVAELTVLCRLAWQRKVASHSCCEQDSSSSEEQEEDKDEEEEDLNEAHRFLLRPTLSPILEVPDMCRNLKHLVHDLLFISRDFSQRTSMPEIYPATGMDSSFESWSISLQNRIFYQLLVVLRPPCGHSFILEQVTMGQQPDRCSDIHVELECMCSSEHGMEYNLCFLHPTDKRLPQDQRSPLLRTLCTESYLNVEKTAHWAQNLLEAAWWRLPRWPRRHLWVLRSSRTCRFLMISPSERQTCTEMYFVVQQGGPGSYLVLE
ncbi:inositol 1,4,5-trisphosphate receptor-interacting protein-like 1 [Manacus vitellinus]|uniref:inositol 1,4,5-trisphosphate receptor-interacting protein-like 1 n=1 Tax=Manacus vitellinus TaxID=328815 RepID=UPI00115EFA31|nr:inositol 1,4,5-trisphosphate receptor-interacting protein-like 1 [Manacus vitellinus]